MASPREPSGIASPGQVKLRPLLYGGIDWGEGKGVGVSTNGGSCAPALFLFPNVFICKGSSAISSTDGNKSITAL